MSQHTAHFNLTHPAMLATVLGLGTLNAHAISLDQPNIQSEQNQPLSATINVSNIDANNFNASIAPSSIYAQMGLNQTADIKATFVRTSDTTGKIVLTSSQPISAPFADIVLNLNNNGKQVVEPQTLLMPMPKEGNIAQMDTPIIANDFEQELPIVTENTEPTLTEIDTPVLAPIANPNLNANDTNIDDGQDFGSEAAKTTPPSHSTPLSPVKDKVSTDSNTQLQVLTEKITRRIIPTGSAPRPPVVDNESNLPPTIAKPQPNKTDKHNTQHTKGDTAPSYVVQSGDSLWAIAAQIAKANQMSIGEVMRTLHEQNPHAFNDGKINQLKTQATLNLPNYDVIPSQKAIQEAISARRKVETSAPRRPAPSPARQTQKATTASSRPRTITKPLPRPQVTLVTPSQSKQALGGNTRTDTGGTADNNQLVSTLKNTRNQTAQTARRVNGLNQELSSATQKLQLQNQKLAELEARLKALKSK